MQKPLRSKTDWHKCCEVSAGLHNRMSKLVETIAVPNTLKQGAAGIEQLYEIVAKTPRAVWYILDMKAVKFVEPCGVIALLTVIRFLSEMTRNRVLIQNLDEQVYLYLHRMNLFHVAAAWLKPLETLSEEWSRNAHTVNLLELTEVTGYDDMTAVIERARGIFAPWLSSNDLPNLLRVISELCQNIYQHSGDTHGCVLIQKYQSEAQNRISICLSVGDLGCGIRASLIGRFKGLGDEPLDFVRAAMDGSFTSRRHGRGGLGLRTVRDITTAYGGCVTVRSETAGVTDWGKSGINSSGQLTYIAGTQVNVKMRVSNYC